MLKTITIPEEYICPLAQKIMYEPVIASDGNTYEREAIDTWLKNHNSSPLTRKKLESKLLIPSLTIEKKIRQFLKLNPEIFDSEEVYLPKYLITELASAIKCNNIIATNKLIKQNRSLLTVYVENDYTALHLICEHGSVTMLKYFVEVWYDYLPVIATLPKPKKWLPIYLWDFVDEAFEANNQELVNLLVWLGAKSPERFYYEIPAFTALSNGYRHPQLCYQH